MAHVLAPQNGGTGERDSASGNHRNRRRWLLVDSRVIMTMSSNGPDYGGL